MVTRMARTTDRLRRDLKSPPGQINTTVSKRLTSFAEHGASPQTPNFH